MHQENGIAKAACSGRDQLLVCAHHSDLCTCSATMIIDSHCIFFGIFYIFIFVLEGANSTRKPGVRIYV